MLTAKWRLGRNHIRVGERKVIGFKKGHDTLVVGIGETFVLCIRVEEMR
jgi:hypothetical protein